MTGHTPPYPAFPAEMGVSKAFCPSWPGTVNLQISTSWVAKITGAQLALVIFNDRILLYTQAGLDHNPPICVSHIAGGDKHVPPCPAIGWDVVLWMFCPDWPWTAILPISTSWVTRVTVLSHCASCNLFIEIFIQKLM
jgi:hypothetical protein